MLFFCHFLFEFYEWSYIPYQIEELFFSKFKSSEVIQNCSRRACYYQQDNPVLGAREQRQQADRQEGKKLSKDLESIDASVVLNIYISNKNYISALVIRWTGLAYVNRWTWNIDVYINILFDFLSLF